MGRHTIERESRVSEKRVQSAVSGVPREIPRGKIGGPPSKPKYYPVTDSEQYCEGTVKSTPGGE